MLTRLHIRNYTLIDHLELDFGPGFSALTGETGAGKSILIDALGLLLGDRARSDLIRAGATRAELSAEFDLRDLPAAGEWLVAEGLDDGEACVLRRVLQRDGGSRMTINGRPVTAQSLRDMGPLLLEIHGQHAHQSLLQGGAQRELLDRIGGHEALLGEVSLAHQALKAALEDLETLENSARQAGGQAEWIQNQIEELRELAPRPAEWAALVAEHRRHAHGERLLALTRATLGRLAGEDGLSAIDALQQGQRDLEEARRLDPRLDEVAVLVDQALIPAQEAERALTHYLADTEVDPERLAWLDERLGRYHQLARKHHRPPEDLQEVLARLEADLVAHAHFADRRDHLAQEIARQRAGYDRATERLGAARREIAPPLAAQIEAQVRPLGLPHARIGIGVDTLPERLSPQGRERVEITIGMNPGQPLQPLARVASGGELARVALAIAVVAANQGPGGSMIFDEIDVGVGGAVAELIGERLARLAQHRQVLCVTHQAQVAAHARQHYQVSKAVVDEETRTRVRALGEAEAEEELARMLGGRVITERARAHARELRAQASHSAASAS